MVSGSLFVILKGNAMIKKWFKRALAKEKDYDGMRRHKIPLLIANRAVEKVLNTLHQAGFEAYVVGGAVRDLLLGHKPKDFDVATNATPKQVNKLFNRSRIIGRRFQIVHVMVGADVIEVTTFRSGHKVKQNEHGRIVRDNAYGTLTQDAQRRDFTCNALYYDVQRQEIIDFHNGLDDVYAKRLVMIGESSERYQEDPVRILRAIRLAGKLDFVIDEATVAPIGTYFVLLRKEPIARLVDELLKIIFSGNAEGCLKQMKQLRLHDAVHPILTALFQAAENRDKHIGALALSQTDKRVQEGKSVSVGFVLAALFWKELQKYWFIFQERGHKSAAAMQEAVNQLHQDMEQHWGIPQRYLATMREIWLLQPQFENRRGARPFKLIGQQQRFRAAYDFLLLRSDEETDLVELADWWLSFQAANEKTRQEMVDLLTMQTSKTQEGKTSKRRRKPKSKKLAN